MVEYLRDLCRAIDSTRTADELAFAIVYRFTLNEFNVFEPFFIRKRLLLGNRLVIGGNLTDFRAALDGGFAYTQMVMRAHRWPSGVSRR